MYGTVPRTRSFPGDLAAGVGGGRHPPGEPEVQDLHQAVARHHEVPGLQVPVHDARRVRLREAGRDLGGELEQLLHGEGTVLEHLLERPALHQLHRDEARPLVLADLVDGGDVRMVEGRGGTSLSLEAPPLIRVARRRLGEDLDRDLAAEAGVAGPIDLAHPPRTDQVREPRTGRAGSRGRPRASASPPPRPAPRGAPSPPPRSRGATSPHGEDPRPRRRPPRERRRARRAGARAPRGTAPRLSRSPVVSSRAPLAAAPGAEELRRFLRRGWPKEQPRGPPLEPQLGRSEAVGSRLHSPLGGRR